MQNELTIIFEVLRRLLPPFIEDKNFEFNFFHSSSDKCKGTRSKEHTP